MRTWKSDAAAASNETSGRSRFCHELQAAARCRVTGCAEFSEKLLADEGAARGYLISLSLDGRSLLSALVICFVVHFFLSSRPVENEQAEEVEGAFGCAEPRREERHGLELARAETLGANSKDARGVRSCRVGTGLLRVRLWRAQCTQSPETGRMLFMAPKGLL